MANFLSRLFSKSTVAPKGFDAGKEGRRLAAIPRNRLAINSQVRIYGRTALARSRYLCANNAYAVSAKESFCAALVGDGIKPSWLIEDDKVKEGFQELWRDWTDYCDATGETDFYGLQYMIACELFEAGECFVRIRKRTLADGYDVPVQLQLLPSEMCPVEYNLLTGGGGESRIESGIEFNAIGQRTAYHFFKSHPGETFQLLNAGTTILTRVPADEIMHVKLPMRVGQLRGVPKMLSSIAPLALMDLYDDAELERKRTAALFGAFITRKLGDDGDDDHPLGTPGHTTQDPREEKGHGDRNRESFTLEPGIVADLEDGEDIKFGEPADVGGNYEAFQYRNLTKIAAGAGSPYAGVSGDLRQTSFGSIRAGTIDDRRRKGVIQNHFLIPQFCCPALEIFTDTAALYRELPVSPSKYRKNRKGYTRVKWIAGKWDWIDPLKDIQAEVIAIQNRLKPRSDAIEEGGLDAEETDKRIAADLAREKRLGLPPLAPPATTTVPPDDPGDNE